MIREVVLSNRLKALTDMVSRGNRVVDVGCDHGFVSIYLVQHEISPKVLAMDVRKGPLSRAQEHIAEYGLEAYIETRLSDGLLKFEPGEADTLVCAGMGGPLMMKILTESEEKVRGLKELILQPQSELPQFRKFLRTQGYRTVDENILCEEGKYYFLFKVSLTDIGTDEFAHPDMTEQTRDDMHCGSDTMSLGTMLSDAVKGDAEIDLKLCDKYGGLLLQRRHPVLREYLEYSVKTAEQIKSSLTKNGDGERAQDRLAEIEQELADLNKALNLYL